LHSSGPFASSGDAGLQDDADGGPSEFPCPSQPLLSQKTCGQPTDCVVVDVFVACCTANAVGLNERSLAQFLDASAGCSTLDPCDCTGIRVVAEDGRVSVNPKQTDVVVICADGECVTTVR